MFLLKYFKYECALCQRLCSHILVADFCCRSAVCLPCSQLICDQLEDIIAQESQYNVDCTITLGECLICAQEMQQTKTLLIRDPTQAELNIIAKKTQASVKRREAEQQTASKAE